MILHVSGLIHVSKQLMRSLSADNVEPNLEYSGLEYLVIKFMYMYMQIQMHGTNPILNTCPS